MKFVHFTVDGRSLWIPVSLIQVVEEIRRLPSVYAIRVILQSGSAQQDSYVLYNDEARQFLRNFLRVVEGEE